MGQFSSKQFDEQKFVVWSISLIHPMYEMLNFGMCLLSSGNGDIVLTILS